VSTTHEGLLEGGANSRPGAGRAPGPGKGYKGLPLEGPLARWYARITGTGKNLGEFRKLAGTIAGQVAEGGRVLEVAPGPGHLAIALARLGGYRITGLDISHSFVRMAAKNASRAGVEISFQQGDAAAMPFASDSFDFCVCRAAFKNFTRPVEALKEMYRVLRPGAKALILDLRRDAPVDAIDAEVRGMGLGSINSLLIELAFKHMLLKRAYSQEQFRQMVAQTPFKSCEVRTESIGLEVSLTR
jgi:ubiquinone/menaquinone biosynthesis C-methylase UbiE